MMWDTANSQYYFTDINYPDFGIAEFDTAIQEYEKRGKRRGK
jgi:undecaprenyl diphosphate synthase